MTALSNNYPNPLDNFRTYSFQYVMSVAGSTETFRKMIDDGGRSMLAAAGTAGLGEPFAVGPSNTAWLVLDTRRFSQYSITDMQMEHTFGTGTVSNPSVPLNSMSMKIIDTTGLSFFNMLMMLFRDRLQTTKASAFFLLSVIFSGHRDDGSVEHVSTCHIPLSLMSMEFTFTSSGSQYDIQMMEITGSPQRGAGLKQINYLGAVNSISTEAWSSNTIGSMLDDLEQQLNIQSLEFYQKFNNTANASGSTAAGKLVQYMITAPATAANNWRAMKISTASRSFNIEQQFTSMNTGERPATPAQVTAQLSGLRSRESRAIYSQLTFTSTSDITDAIKAILESSDEFLALASEDRRKAGTAQIFKISTSITSDDTTFVVHFDILPYFLPKVSTQDKDKQNTQTVAAGSSTRNVLGGTKVIKNLISYDYIFTGKNSHIKDLKVHFGPNADVALDTNLQLGRSRLASVAEVGQSTSRVSAASAGAKKTTSFSPLIRGRDPIFPSMRSREQQNNNSAQKNENLTKDQAAENFKQKQEYNQTMAYVNFLGSLQLDMDVRGNPNIIRKFADKNGRDTFPPHLQIISSDALRKIVFSSSTTAAASFQNNLRTGVATAKQQYVDTFMAPKIAAVYSARQPADPLLNGVDPATLPVFVKVNIKAPNTDHVGSAIDGEPLYTDRFFYNGYYQLLMIRTTFDSGQFSHAMTLIPYVVDENASTK